MNNTNIHEIIEDFYQIIEIAYQSTNYGHEKFTKCKQDFLECNYRHYDKKYQLKHTKFYKTFKRDQFRYNDCSVKIASHFFFPIARQYTREMTQNFPELSKKEQDLIFKSCFHNIIINKKTGWQQRPIAISQHQFREYCNTKEKQKHIIDPKHVYQELCKTKLGSKEMSIILLKYQQKLIKSMNDTGFINLLIHHTENREQSIISKENICQSLLNLNENCSDTLMLFIFWLNKYIKFLTRISTCLVPTKIEQYILSHQKRKNNWFYQQLYCDLTDQTDDDYEFIKVEYESIISLISSSYQLKDYCINLLLKLQLQTNHSEYLFLSGTKNEPVINYYNPITSLSGSFHIKQNKINNTYLQTLPFKEEPGIKQSIPEKAMVKLYYKPKFEDIF